VTEPITIMLVDDSAADRMLVKLSLEDSKLINKLVMAEEGAEALSILRGGGELPSLILLDLNMPGMDGREFLKQIKADPDLKAIPVVVLSSSLAEQDVLGSYENYCSGYIAKPVTLEGLVKVVATLEEYWFAIVQRPR